MNSTISGNPFIAPNVVTFEVRGAFSALGFSSFKAKESLHKPAL
jgi:hypothetical protein